MPTAASQLIYNPPRTDSQSSRWRRTVSTIDSRYHYGIITYSSYYRTEDEGQLARGAADTPTGGECAWYTDARLAYY